MISSSMPLAGSLIIALASALVVSCRVPDRPKAPTLPTASRPLPQFDDEDFDLWIDDVELLKAP